MRKLGMILAGVSCVLSGITIMLPFSYFWGFVSLTGAGICGGAALLIFMFMPENTESGVQ